MNQYIFLRRMRGPIFLLTFGVTAILDEYTGVHYHQSWPLYIIVWGILLLAENALLAQSPPAPPAPYPGQPTGSAPAGPSYGSWNAPAPEPQTPASNSTAIVPTSGEEIR